MRPMANFTFTPSRHQSEEQNTLPIKGPSFFDQHPIFKSKPSDVPPSPSGSLFGFNPRNTLFSFTAESADREPLPSQSATWRQKEPSSSLPTFSFTASQHSDGTKVTRSRGIKSMAPPMNSLTRRMAGLDTGSPDGAASPSGASISGNSNHFSPSVTTSTSKATSQADTTAESELSDDEDSVLTTHLGLLQRRPELDELSEIISAPIFTESVRKYAHSLAGSSQGKPFSQYGLLAGDLTGSIDDSASDPRMFWNIAAPSSFFICGSQGSGKSHTLSCLLENALAPCGANVLPRPLTGIVFHYDTFISDSGGLPCEAASLSSNPSIKVRVLCPPTNIRTMKRLYQEFPSIKVEELRLNESDLNTKRMLDLMAVNTGGSLPLYLHVVQRVLRDLRVKQQQSDMGFNYSEFKQSIAGEALTEMQLAPLKQRLETLESFMVESQAKAYNMPGSFPAAKQKTISTAKGTSWEPHNGHLTIVDLSCPCVTPEMACSLFNICLSLFLEQDSTKIGRIIALDEAHKYMTESQECTALTEALLATIRLQRHVGARVLISTQEPTISPKLLDLCSVTVVHRFTSPDWLNALKKHLAGVLSGGRLLEKARKLKMVDDDGQVEGAGALALGDADPALELFSRIVDLRVGEALMFAPSAIIGVKKRMEGGKTKVGDVQRLAHGVLKVRIRNRTTADGGRSIMAA